MIRLQDITPQDRVRGLKSEPVTIVQTRWVDEDALEVSFRTAAGVLEERIVFEEEEADLHLVDEAGNTAAPDVLRWKIGVEAFRLANAAYVDPMHAVSSSSLQPLPHQITAVYGEFLPRRPLRYLLADDPGAGKTIMCGLYIKELILRRDLSRCLIVAPGGLVDQWSHELYDKFGLTFTVMTRELVNTAVTGDVFAENPLLIARMDMLANDDALLEKIREAEWDLVVVDEAHRMSASGTNPDSKRTNRYELGQILSEACRNFLLLTATPHSGDPERFQAFMALLDRDRFGSHRAGQQTPVTTDLMRRMLKEELRTLQGTRLFPERRAQTVPYPLSAIEADLYDEVTTYVNEEMNRAEARMKGQARVTVGFALLVLQRRLASSPEAILQSLHRRHARLRGRREELTTGSAESLAPVAESSVTGESGVDDVAASESREHSGQLDAATAAETLAELDHELSTLERLIALAAKVRTSEADQKWLQLKSILSSSEVLKPDGTRRKLIVFSEHRDTLNYLQARIEALLGRAPLQIHGGLRREARLAVQHRFVTDPAADILLATDAAGEGLNLQAASLMVNYDLPWNPNRLEQRFGRIHRIGQTEVCHLWNLVSEDTREGAVYLRLLEKVEEQSSALQGKVYDVLGDAFVSTSLEELLTQAIRRGESPETKSWWTHVVDTAVADEIPELLRQRALNTDVLKSVDLELAQRRAESGRLNALQPHYTGPWLIAALQSLGGAVRSVAGGRHDIRLVPAVVKDEARRGTGAVQTIYSGVSLGRHDEAADGAPVIGATHPLFEATTAATQRGWDTEHLELALVVDPWTSESEPRLLIASTSDIVDGCDPAQVLSRRVDLVELNLASQATDTVGAAYLDYREPTTPELDRIQAMVATLGGPAKLLDRAQSWAIAAVRDHRREVQASHGTAMERQRREIEDSLTREARHWDAVATGDVRSTTTPETARRRADDARARLSLRRRQFDAEAQTSAQPPKLHAVALVVPAALAAGRAQAASTFDGVAGDLSSRGLTATKHPDHPRLWGLQQDDRTLWCLPVDRPLDDVVLCRRTDVAAGLNLGSDFALLLNDGAGRLRITTPKVSMQDFEPLGTHAISWSWDTLWRAGRSPS